MRQLLKAPMCYKPSYVYKAFELFMEMNGTHGAVSEARVGLNGFIFLFTPWGTSSNYIFSLSDFMNFLRNLKTGDIRCLSPNPIKLETSPNA
jgi:hypothetical protein